MEKTNNLNSKIKSYTALATGIAAAAGASAQVQYTDLNPDTVLTLSGNNQYALDFNGGGANPDIGFEVTTSSSMSVTTFLGQPVNAFGTGGVAGFGSTAPATNGFMGSVTGSSAVTFMAASNLSSGNPIGPTQSFTQTDGIIGLYGFATVNSSQVAQGTYGKFNATTGFMGVRFDIAGQTHYGWVRVQMNSKTQMTIYDYAYEATPNTAISAGDMGSSSIDETALDNLIQVVRNRNNTLVIRNNGITNGTANIISTNGSVVSNTKINNETEIINLNNLATGIYVVNIVANEGTLTKKIYVK